MPTPVAHPLPPTPGSARAVFAAFLKLGLTSFGGPIAHLGYFRETFVRRLRWLDEAQYAQLLAVCQFLPGPASSQMGFAIGLLRAGWRGAWAAFVAFTLPSALLLAAVALLAPQWGSGSGAAVVHGLKLVAVVVVAHAVWGMLRLWTPDVPRLLLATVGAALILYSGHAWTHVLVIALGALLGPWCCRHARAPAPAEFAMRYGAHGALLALGVFVLMLVASYALPSQAPPTAQGVAAAFYQAGALVFGGGHVVLPLLQHSVVDSGWLSVDTFLAGYGAAQAVPGPMFALAAYLGAALPLDLPPALGAVTALLAVFLPGFLLVLAVLPMWSTLTQHPLAARCMAGMNAAVVGLLIAALYDPVCTTALRGPSDVVIALIGYAMLSSTRCSALWIVLWCVLAALGARAWT